MEERTQLLRRVRFILWGLIVGGALILGISLAVALTRQSAPEPINPVLLVTPTPPARPTSPPTTAPPAPVTPSPSGPPATVRLSPAQLELVAGQTGTVSVELDEVKGLFGAQVHVNYDPTLLEVQDADPARDGVQAQEGTFPDPRGGRGFVAANQANSATGEIIYALTLLAPNPPVDGSGTLFRIEVKGLRPGKASLSISKAILVGPAAVDIPITTQGTEVLVR